MNYYKVLLSNTMRHIYRNLEMEKIKINAITGHGFRHTHTTILLGQGVADRLGNTPETLLETYAHSFDELKEQAVLSFSQTLQNVTNPVAEK